MANSMFTDKQKQQIAKLYADGKSSFFLATKFNTTANTILRIVRSLGVAVRPQGRPVSNR